MPCSYAAAESQPLPVKQFGGMMAPPYNATAILQRGTSGARDEFQGTSAPPPPLPSGVAEGAFGVVLAVEFLDRELDEFRIVLLEAHAEQRDFLERVVVEIAPEMLEACAWSALGFRRF